LVDIRIRSRKNLKKKNTAIVLLFLMPIIGFAGYAAGLLIIINDMASYTYEIPPPDTQYFHTWQEIDPNKMALVADAISTRMNLYHLTDGITNLSVDCSYSDTNYDTVEKRYDTDNAALYGGQTLGAQCLRYATAKKENNQTEMDNAMVLIRKLVHGFSLLLAVPNGGIGPDYPGIPGRFYAPPGYEDIFPEVFSDAYKMYNGTGIYSNWRVRLKTSLDEMGGYALALGSVLNFVDPSDSPDAKYVYETVRLMVAQLIEGFKKTNWMVIHGDGYPAGSDLNMDIGGGTWKLAFLKLGALAYPEKYTSDYAYTATKMLHLHGAQEGSVFNTIMEYYAFNFANSLVFSLIMNEDNPNLRYWYIKLYVEGFYDILKYHRNAWVSSTYLAYMSMLDENEKQQFINPLYDIDKVTWDVNDQVYRFYRWANPAGMSLTQDKWGIRNYNLIQRPHSTRATSANPEIRKMERDPTPKKWRDFFETPMGKIYAWAADDLFNFNDHYLLPITVSESSPGANIFGSNPFYSEGNRHAKSGDGLFEERGNDFMLPYYIGRYYGFIEGPTW
jgi:hypothetical protein